MVYLEKSILSDFKDMLIPFLVFYRTDIQSLSEVPKNKNKQHF